ncbi:hypothetical protein OnM2_099036 [Erysiphe neolycopersici]|uniref:Uncharacterized protein n=1 Tax=Erysiphe neolycopersici TaxID=212602 RepID=A0A420HA52_9PEZI|nr:hypothetical protein OnM2_099036 [Erysiphe neolycopersici]
MPSLSTVWVSSLLLIWSCIIRQSVASPMQLHVRRDNIASLNARSPVADGEIHPRFAAALFGGLATTVVGNALGGAISPMFAKFGEKLSTGKTQPEPIPEEDQTEEAPAEVPAEKPATQAKASKAQLAAEETEDSSSVNQSSAEETEKLYNSSKSSKSEKKDKLKELELEEDE